MSDQKAEPRNVTLYPTDRAVIERVMHSMHTDNFSAAVQFIIRDWEKLKKESEGTRTCVGEREK